MLLLLKIEDNVVRIDILDPQKNSSNDNLSKWPMLKSVQILSHPALIRGDTKTLTWVVFEKQLTWFFNFDQGCHQTCISLSDCFVTSQMNNHTSSNNNLVIDIVTFCLNPDLWIHNQPTKFPILFALSLCSRAFCLFPPPQLSHSLSLFSCPVLRNRVSVPSCSTFVKEFKDSVWLNSAAEHWRLLVMGTSGNHCFYSVAEDKAGMNSAHKVTLFPGAITELWSACFTSATAKPDWTVLTFSAHL